MTLLGWLGVYAAGAVLTAYIVGRLGEDDEPGSFEILTVLIWPVALFFGILFMPYFSGRRARSPNGTPRVVDGGNVQTATTPEEANEIVRRSGYPPIFREAAKK